MPQVLLLPCESASSSNRGRIDGISHGKYRVGKVKRVKMGADLGAINTANDAPSLQDQLHREVHGRLWSCSQGYWRRT